MYVNTFSEWIEAMGKIIDAQIMCSKCMPPNITLSLCTKFQIDLSATCCVCPTLHFPILAIVILLIIILWQSTMIWSCQLPKLFGKQALTDWLDLNKDSIELKLWDFSCLIQTFQKEPVTVPVSCTYLPIIGVWNIFNFIETYTMHEHHISLTCHLVAGNRLNLPDNKHTLLYAQ